jgi:hypothetical protein
MTLNPNYPNIALLALADKIRKDCSELAAEAPAPNIPSKKRSAPAAPLRSPSDDGTKANTHHNVVWLNIVSNDTKQDWHKVRTLTHD